METAQNKMTKETLGQLIIDSEETMYHIAKSLLYNDADCADAIQEAIVKAFAKLHTLKDDSYAKTWLIRIVMNECYAIMRKEKKIISLQDYQMNEQETESKDYSDLYEAIFHLPEQIKLCVTLYYMEGYSVKEVAALLDTTESAVKNRLAKARGKLKEALAAAGEQPCEKSGLQRQQAECETDDGKRKSTLRGWNISHRN